MSHKYRGRASVVGRAGQLAQPIQRDGDGGERGGLGAQNAWPQGDRLPAVSHVDLEALGLAVESGLGVALLPWSLARQLAVIEIEAEAAGGESPGPAPTR